MLNCIYHPTEKMRVVDDVEYEKLLATGLWFKHPNEAKEVRAKYERKILEEQRLHNKRRERGSNLKQPSKNGGEPTQSNE